MRQTLKYLKFGTERLLLVHDVVILSFHYPLRKKRISVGAAIEDLPELRNGASIDILPYKKKPKGKYAKSLRTETGMVSGNLVTNNAPYVLGRYSHVPMGGNWKDIPRISLEIIETRIGAILESIEGWI